MAGSILVQSPKDGLSALRRLREAARLSQRRHAAAAGIEQSQLSRIEAARDIRLSTFLSLAQTLGYEVRLVPRPAMSADNAAEETLAELVARALREHQATAFWSTPTDLPLAEMAEVAVARLRKYGGRKGWFLAADISRQLEILHAD